MSADHPDNAEPSEPFRMKPTYDHLFPWSEFLEQIVATPQLFELRRPNRPNPTLRSMKSVWFSADEIQRSLPPGEVDFSFDEELRIKVVGEFWDYLSTNYEGFVESDLIVGGAFTTELFRAIHYAWLDRDPATSWLAPSVAYIAELVSEFKKEGEQVGDGDAEEAV